MVSQHHGACSREATVTMFHVMRITGMMALWVVIFSSGCAATRSFPKDHVIEADMLSAMLSHGRKHQRIVLLDARNEQQYHAGHVEGAVRVDADQWKKESFGSDTGLSQRAYWAGRIGSVGVDGKRPVVVYDDGRMTEAARIWFLLHHAGVPQVAVLNGGYPILQPWLTDGSINVTTQAAMPVAVTFVAASDEEPGTSVGMVDRVALLGSIEKKSVQVFDARTKDEYTGKAVRKSGRSGHLPTAINLPHKQLLDEQGRLKPADDLAAILKDAGFVRGVPIVAHCESGGRSSLAALAAYRAGYGPILNYYLSFSDWTADVSCPVESGE